MLNVQLKKKYWNHRRSTYLILEKWSFLWFTLWNGTTAMKFDTTTPLIIGFLGVCAQQHLKQQKLIFHLSIVGAHLCWLDDWLSVENYFNISPTIVCTSFSVTRTNWFPYLCFFLWTKIHPAAMMILLWMQSITPFQSCQQQHHGTFSIRNTENSKRKHIETVYFSLKYSYRLKNHTRYISRW